MSREALETLHADSLFGDVDPILREVTKYYRNVFPWLGNELSYRHEAQPLIDVVARLSPVDAVFLFRSSPIRYYIDKLVNGVYRIDAADPERQVIENWNCLDHAITSVVDKSGSLNGHLFASNPITEPYPLNVCLWADGDDSAFGWTEAREVNRMFQAEMSDSVGSRRCVLRVPTAEQRQSFESAFEYLADNFDYIAQDIAGHVRFLAVIDYADWRNLTENDYREIGQSVSSHLVPTCSFFSLYSIADQERLIESIYHEALHKKLSNLILVRSILRGGYDTLKSPRFHSFWNRDTKWNSNQWEFDRTLYAYHVYVHLYCFYGAICEAARGSVVTNEFAKKRRADSLMRAKAMEPWLFETAPSLMGAEGIPFLCYMSEALNRSKSARQ
jgi:hypothetical protein